MGIMQKIFGTYSERELKRIYPIQKKVLDLEEKYRAMSDEELKKTEQLVNEMILEANHVTATEMPLEAPNINLSCRRHSLALIRKCHHLNTLETQLTPCNTCSQVLPSQTSHIVTFFWPM